MVQIRLPMAIGSRIGRHFLRIRTFSCLSLLRARTLQTIRATFQQVSWGSHLSDAAYLARPHIQLSKRSFVQIKLAHNMMKAVNNWVGYKDHSSRVMLLMNVSISFFTLNLTKIDSSSSSQVNWSILLFSSTTAISVSICSVDLLSYSETSVNSLVSML